GINEWNGNKKAQIVMEDMRIDEWQLFDHRGKKQMDISPYVENGKRNVILHHSETGNGERIPAHVNQITYDTNLNDIPVTDVLYIFDLPTDLHRLKEIIRSTMPLNIHACYYVADST